MKRSSSVAAKTEEADATMMNSKIDPAGLPQELIHESGIKHQDPNVAEGASHYGEASILYDHQYEKLHGKTGFTEEEFMARLTTSEAESMRLRKHYEQLTDDSAANKIKVSVEDAAVPVIHKPQIDSTSFD